MKQNAHILFQGDSITDCGRNYAEPGNLGGGYALMTASMLASSHPELELRFTNKGISGNRTRDLLARWEEDCISLQPDYLTILIGINNTWRRYDANDPTSTEQFRKEYDELLTLTTDKTDAQIVLCEPFLLHVTEDVAAWREDLDPKIAVVHEMSEKFGTQLVAFDKEFQKLQNTPSPSYWAGDGVHVGYAGHGLMAGLLAKCLDSM
jgi:acyl-CoA thioesterase-1